MFFFYIEDTHLVNKCEYYERYVKQIQGKKYQGQIAKVPFNRLFASSRRPISRKRVHLHA